MRSDIQRIVQEEMSEVVFIHDYLELRFHGKIIRALAMPTIEIDGRVYQLPFPGSRDALCSLIDHSAVEVIVRDGEQIMIRFENNAVVTIPLHPTADYDGPEYAHFLLDERSPLEIW